MIFIINTFEDRKQIVCEVVLQKVWLKTKRNIFALNFHLINLIENLVLNFIHQKRLIIEMRVRFYQ